MVPAAPPTRKNQRATSCPAPISAKVPYLLGSRLIRNAFWCVSSFSRSMPKQITGVARRSEGKNGCGNHGVASCALLRFKISGAPTRRHCKQVLLLGLVFRQRRLDDISDQFVR